MKIKNLVLLVGLCMMLGSLALACAAELNPNTEKQLVSALNGKHDAFKACYETALTKDREVQGNEGLLLAIDKESGAVTTSSIEKTDIKDADMGKCVANATMDIKLPEPPNVPVEGHYNVAFGFEK